MWTIFGNVIRTPTPSFRGEWLSRSELARPDQRIPRPMYTAFSVPSRNRNSTAVSILVRLNLLFRCPDIAVIRYCVGKEIGNKFVRTLHANCFPTACVSPNLLDLSGEYESEPEHSCWSRMLELALLLGTAGDEIFRCNLTRKKPARPFQRPSPLHLRPG